MSEEKTYPIRAGEVKKGSIVLLQGNPCRVNEVKISKPGKHGHAKATITGIEIFTGKKYQDVSATSHNMTAPFVTRTEYILTDIGEDNYCFLMDNETGTLKEDLVWSLDTVPDLDSDKEVIVTVTKAMDSEKITDFKLVN